MALARSMWSGAFDGAKRPQSLADYVGRFGNESGRPLYEFAHNPMPSAEEVMAEHEKAALDDGVGRGSRRRFELEIDHSPERSAVQIESRLDLGCFAFQRGFGIVRALLDER